MGAILDFNGNLMVEYTYDAWGKLLNTVDNSGINLGTINPLRYRGYYYDQETGLYYLQSRYYDPTVGRFINSDDVSFLGINGTVVSHNLFAYCENNTINYFDPTGRFVIRRWMISSVADFLLSFIPGISPFYAPIKSMAKQYKRNGLAQKIAGPLADFVEFIARNSERVLRGLKNKLTKIWLIGRFFRRLPVDNWIVKIARWSASFSVNKLATTLANNIDILLSLGGLIAGFFDYVFDGKINDRIVVI